MSFVTRQDLIDRISNDGLIFLADDDDDSVVSEAEKVASLDRAITTADAEIEAALLPWFTLPLNQTNDWLKERAIDIGIEHLAARKGSEIPSALFAAARRSHQWLEQVRTGELRVPGLVYPVDRFAEEVRKTGLPRVNNPGK